MGSTDPVHPPSRAAGACKHWIDFERLQEMRNLYGESITLLTFVHVGKDSANSANNNKDHEDYTSVPLLGLLHQRRGNFDVLTNCIQQFHDAVDNRIIDEVNLFN